MKLLDKRLSDKLKRIRAETVDDSVTYKLLNVKLLKDEVQIDEFNFRLVE